MRCTPGFIGRYARDSWQVLRVSSGSRRLIVSEAGPAPRVTLNRPDKRKLSLQLMDELVRVLQSLGARHDVRAIVVEGAGVAFSADHDLSEMVGAGPALLPASLR